jgi:peptidoglycan-associated lipoprotein
MASEPSPSMSFENMENVEATEKVKQKNIVYKHNIINEDIYFKYNSSILSLEAKRVLQRKAAWLRLSHDVMVIIEGHCDERGTTTYNFNLGQRRAENVKEYMIWQGISTTRLKTISYGEKRPVSTNHNENAWAKNRRVHFLIKE